MVTALFVLLTETTGRQAHAVLHGFCKRGRGKEGVYSRGILNQSHQVAANLNRATSPTASYDCRVAAEHGRSAFRGTILREARTFTTP